MSDDLISRIRERIEQLQGIKSLSHDQRVIEAIDGVIKNAEADIRTLENGGSGGNE